MQSSTQNTVCTTAPCLFLSTFWCDIWKLTSLMPTIIIFSLGISHQIVAHRLAGEWWEARTLILPQYRALPHSVKLLPPSIYSFTQCYRNIADVLSIWVFPVDYLVVRKSTLQKSHYSLILGAWGWPSRDPIFPLPTESILLRWSIQHRQWAKKRAKNSSWANKYLHKNH